MANDDTTVEITYKSPDMQPPLFVAGSFSNPPWTPEEMKYTEIPSGEHVFTRAIHVKPGTTVQYKFRVGSGDWWILDESMPTDTDEMGNRNNVLKVADHKRGVVEKPPTPPPDSPSLQAADVNLGESAEPESAISKGPMGNLKRELAPPSRSNASTPSFVRTTIEVADSAAQVDKEAPEPEIPDAEAGRLGVRRLSSTPISEVANTAAEVADTAEQIDEDGIEDESTAVDIGPEFTHERPGEDDNGQDSAPLFAYEFAGGHDKQPSESDYSPEPYPMPEQDEETFDPDDPTLERFPSNRVEILEKVRTIETGLNEDRTSFDGFPASPVVNPGRKSSVDLAGDMLSISPTTTTNKPQSNRRSETQQSSSSKDRESVHSTPSLHCIVEENADDQQGASLSEAVSGRGLSPGLSPTDRSVVPTPGSPAIVVHDAEESTSSKPPPIEGQSSSREDEGARASDDPEAEDTNSLSHAATTAGGGEPQRSGTPASRQSTATEAAKNTNWFKAFFRLIFVDFLGGFLGKLLPWRRS